LLLVVVLLANSVFGIDSGFQDYSSGYYTRGLDTATYLEQPGGIINPFYVPAKDWSIVPRLTLTATWDDNLYLSSDDPESAGLIEVIPGALLMFGLAQHNYLFIDAGIIYSAYDSTDQLANRANYMLTLGAVYRTGKSVLSANAGYRRSENADTVIGERIVKSDYVFDAGIEHELTAKSSGQLSAGIELNNYERGGLSDYTREYVSTRLYHRVTEVSDIYGEVGVGRDDVDAEGDRGDVDFVDATIGFRGRQSAKLAVNGNLGYQWRSPKESGRDDVNHWISSLGFQGNPFGFTTIYGNIDTRLTPAINSLGQTIIDQRYTLGLNRRLFTNRLRGNASAFIGTIDYEGVPVDVSAKNLNRSDDYMGYNLGLDYFTVHNLSFGLSYSYFENKGNQRATAGERERTAYDSSRWVLRASWNY
jgi:hypothetical protein